MNPLGFSALLALGRQERKCHLVAETLGSLVWPSPSSLQQCPQDSWAWVSSGLEFSERGCGLTSHPVTTPGGEACVAQRGGPARGRVGSGVRLGASGSPAPQRCAAPASPARSSGSKRVPLVQRARLHLPATPHQLGASPWLEQQPCLVMGLPLHCVLPDTARAMLLTCTPSPRGQAHQTPGGCKWPTGPAV